MDLHSFTESRKQVLNCVVQDESGLNDFQKLPNGCGTRIPKVGIERFRLPITYKIDDQLRSHDAKASAFINLTADKTGVNMSRFCQILQRSAMECPINDNLIKNTLSVIRSELRDHNEEDLVENAYLNFEFSYPLKQKSLKSDNWGWQYYDVVFSGHENQDGKIDYSLTLNYEYSSTCPCSLSMSKQYEKEYREGKTEEGNGVATAHSQRSLATITINYSDFDKIKLEEFIARVREAIPTETQSLVKRVDEQAFAILNGDYPIFVEHASRRLASALNDYSGVESWNAKISHFESLHSHNAVAYIQSENQR